MLLKPAGNLLKALHKAYLHGDPSRLLNPSNLAVPLLLLETSHALVQLFFDSALFSRFDSVDLANPCLRLFPLLFFFCLKEKGKKNQIYAHI